MRRRFSFRFLLLSVLALTSGSASFNAHAASPRWGGFLERIFGKPQRLKCKARPNARPSKNQKPKDVTDLQARQGASPKEKEQSCRLVGNYFSDYTTAPLYIIECPEDGLKRSTTKSTTHKRMACDAPDGTNCLDLAYNSLTI